MCNTEDPLDPNYTPKQGGSSKGVSIEEAENQKGYGDEQDKIVYRIGTVNTK